MDKNQNKDLEKNVLKPRKKRIETTSKKSGHKIMKTVFNVLDNFSKKEEPSSNQRRKFVHHSKSDSIDKKYKDRLNPKILVTIIEDKKNDIKSTRLKRTKPVEERRMSRINNENKESKLANVNHIKPKEISSSKQPSKEISSNNLKDRFIKYINQNKKLASIACVAVLVLGISGTMYMQSRAAYEMYLGEEKLGTIKDKQMANSIIEELKKKAPEEIKDDVSIGEEISYKRVYVSSDKITPDSLLKVKLEKSIEIAIDSSLVLVNGKEMFTLKSKKEVDELFQKLKEPYEAIEEDKSKIKEIGFLQEVEVKEGKNDFALLKTVEEAYDFIKEGEETTKTYKVQKGDTAWDIAHKYELNVEDIESANPKRDIAKLQIGDEINLNVPEPYISVKVVEEGIFEEKIPYEVAYEDTSNLYTGSKKVKVSGSEGIKEVKAEIVKINGIVSNKNILGETIVKQPVKKVVLKGTKARPKTMAFGKFVNPTRGRVSSRFGYRWGRKHTGVDLANSTGTSIKAADGGRVTFAGWKSGYGKLVIINHENGYQTYYAHCSKLLVSKGSRVFRGQEVAKMGNTGRSTGPHLHFEVRKNGVPQNPLGYVSY
ncbi:MAG: peptidoglycan DD-metalloendopeptidase family protein [Peptostreptococcaceae bacterium]|jgi:murein DD-endopeptidase MepM/ murein hydrolase activator NlpD|nr:peptidoglycan DD-metalloendopeptidase family protein [Peptostreptococcaceae bacterium]